MRYLIFSLAALSLMLVGGMAHAEKQDKVTICHFTESESNPYVVITVNGNSLSTHLDNGDKLYDLEDGCGGEIIIPPQE